MKATATFYWSNVWIIIVIFNYSDILLTTDGLYYYWSIIQITLIWKEFFQISSYLKKLHSKFENLPNYNTLENSRNVLKNQFWAMYSKYRRVIHRSMNTERISSSCSYDIKMSLEGSQNILLVSLVDWEDALRLPCNCPVVLDYSDADNQMAV